MILDAIAHTFRRLAGINVPLRDPSAAVLAYGLLDANTNEAALYLKDGVIYNRLGVALFTIGDTAGLTFNGPVVASTAQALSGAGAVDIVSDTTKLTTTGGAQALTLANGTDGQRKTIIHDVDGGSAVLTPTTKSGFTTITFTNAGETAVLQYTTTRGWVILSLNGAVAA